MDELVDSIKTSVNATHDRRVLGGIGGFAGLFQLGSKYKNPVLVGCTDGVGTKVALSQAHNKTHLTGQDLVAMCVNDMVTCGAEPLFFLDYFAASKLEPKSTAKIVKGIANACKKSNCALLGGETAEMPGHYAKNNFDLAGFSVGVVEKNDLIFGLDYMISPEELAADEIKMLLNQSSFNDTVTFENGLFNVMGTTLDYKSPLLNTTVKGSRDTFSSVDFIIIAIKREGVSQTIIPRGDTEFKLNDQVYFSVPHYSVDKLYPIVGKEHLKIKNVRTIGHTQIGSSRLVSPVKT